MKRFSLSLVFVLVMILGLASGDIFAGEVEDMREVDSLASRLAARIVDLSEAKNSLSVEDAEWVIGEGVLWADIQQKCQKADVCLSARWHSGWMLDVRNAFEAVFESVVCLQGMYEDSVGRAKVMKDMQKTLAETKDILFQDKESEVNW